MKKFIVVMLSLLFFTFLGAQDTNNTNFDVQKLSVIFDGANYKGMNVYVLDNSKFVSIKQVASLFNATLQWQPVSQKIICTINNKRISIEFNSKKIMFGKKSKKLSIPTLFIENELYVPIEFLTLNEFCKSTEFVTSFNDKDNVLTITSKSNISAVRYYTKENSTDIVIELDDKMTYTIKKAKNSIVVAFQRGKIAKDNIVIDNGAIKDISFETVDREAIFKINLSQKPKFVKSKKYRKPLKLVITIEHTTPVDLTQPCKVVLPETVVKTDEEKSGDLKEEQENKIENETNITKQTKETEVVQETSKENLNEKTSTQNVVDEITPPQVDKTAVSKESQIYEKPELEYPDEDDSQALSKVKVASVKEEEIIDNSYDLVDDEESFKEIVPSKNEISKNAKVIVLDAGHGGKDPGAIGPTGIKEKDLNLEIVKYLAQIFKNDTNYKIILTRTTDRFIELSRRTEIANKNNADLFISIHCNANFNRSISGFEIYFLSENASDSQAKATAILENSALNLEDKTDEQKSVLEKMLWSMVINEEINDSSELCSFINSEAINRLKIPNKGIKQANFYVLRGTQMPAVLVECAYLSNYTDESKLQTSKFQKSIADSVYEGVKKYYARKAKNAKE